MILIAIFPSAPGRHHAQRGEPLAVDTAEHVIYLPQHATYPPAHERGTLSARSAGGCRAPAMKDPARAPASVQDRWMLRESRWSVRAAGQ